MVDSQLNVTPQRLDVDIVSDYPLHFTISETDVNQ